MPEERPAAVPTRLVVVPLVVDEERRVLLCRMAPDRGVFPDQWALPGGGVEPGERIEVALRREAREELGVELASLRPCLFKDAQLEKTFPDGTRRPLHMVFLVYECRLASSELTLNEEFSEACWFSRGELAQVALSELTRETLEQAGLLDLRS
jgi:nucleoside triphosphatase